MSSLRTALVLTLTATAATALPAGTAAAEEALPTSAVTDLLPTGAVTRSLPTQYVLGGLQSGLAGGVGAVKHLTLDPLSNTGTDPLDNAVGSQIADFRPVSTAAATGPLARGASLSTLPLVGTAVGLLPG